MRRGRSEDAIHGGGPLVSVGVPLVEQTDAFEV